MGTNKEGVRNLNSMYNWKGDAEKIMDQFHTSISAPGWGQNTQNKINS
jgi:hypothetical protein